MGRRALPEEMLTGLRVRLQYPQFSASLAAELPDSHRELLSAMLAFDPRRRPTADSLQIRLRE